MKKILLLLLVLAFTQITWAGDTDNLVVSRIKFSHTTHSDGNQTRHISATIADQTNEGTTIFLRYFQSKKVLNRSNFMDNLPSDFHDTWDLPVYKEKGAVYFQNVKSTTKTIIFSFRDSQEAASKSKWHMVRVLESTMLSTRCPAAIRFKEIVSPDGAEMFQYEKHHFKKLRDGRVALTLYIKNQSDHPDKLIGEVRTNGLNGESVYSFKNRELSLKKMSEERSSGQRIIGTRLPQVPHQERLVVTLTMKHQTNKWRRFIFCLPESLRQ